MTDRKRYPTTSATSPISGTDTLSTLEGLLNRFAWRTLSLICDVMTDTPGLANFFSARCVDIRRFLIQRGYTWYGTEFDSASQRDFAGYLTATSNQSRSNNETFFSHLFFWKNNSND